MKKISFGIGMMTVLMLLPILNQEASAVSADYRSKSDVSFYGKYEYPTENPIDENPVDDNQNPPTQHVPNQNIPNQNDPILGGQSNSYLNHQVNLGNSYSTLPQLGDVDTHMFNYLGFSIIFAAILLGKRKVINDEIK